MELMGLDFLSFVNVASAAMSMIMVRWVGT